MCCKSSYPKKRKSFGWSKIVFYIYLFICLFIYINALNGTLIGSNLDKNIYYIFSYFFLKYAYRIC